MATALVKFHAPGQRFRKLVQGRWMVTSFEAAPVGTSHGPAAPMPQADERLRTALRVGACPPM